MSIVSEYDFEDKSTDNQSEDTSCCRCCCPAKSTSKRRRRRESVAKAEDELKRVTVFEAKQELVVSSILPGYLPLTFIPDFIIGQIFEDDAFSKVPYSVTSNVVLLMVDVCGFTSLCESYCQKGVTGIEELTSVLNGFMSALTAMLIEAGGDILNFAGDAFLVQWLEYTHEDIEKVVIKAYDCAIALQTHQCLQTRNLNGTLKIKIGVGMGEVSLWVLGSEEFLLFVASGPGLPIVQKAEDMCSPGDIIVDSNIYGILKKQNIDNFEPVILEDDFVKITDYPGVESTTEPEPNRMQLFEKCTVEHLAKARVFLIPGLRDLKSEEELQYVSELTTVTVLFIALLNVNVAQPEVLDQTFVMILDAVKSYEGALNKMLLFDKGCTFLVLFGLPGLKHSNDAARGICCAEVIIDKLQDINIQASIGISSGTCYCGIVGHPQRQEYTALIYKGLLHLILWKIVICMEVMH